MSEPDNKPPIQQKPTKGKKDTLIVKLGDAEVPKKQRVPRAKPTVSSSRMKVVMPGEIKQEEPKKPPVAKKQTVAGPVTPKPKKPASVPAKKKPVPIQQNTPKTKSQVTAQRKPVPRVQVVPPKIGKRRGYRPSVALRLRLPVFLIAFVVCALALFFAFRKEAGPVGKYVSSALQTSFVELTIEPGMGAKTVSKLLKQEGVVDDDAALLQYFMDNNLATTLRSGTFVMEKGMEFEAIGKHLTAMVGQIIVEVSPSFTIATIDAYLDNRGYAKKGEFLKATAALEKERSLSFAEGWLLSGEYTIPKDGAASALAQAMFNAMLKAVQPHLSSEQVSQWGLEQILIIASMIQAETQNVEEMPLIASVIYNRLYAGEPLGIDATTRYEIDDWKHPIPKKALETQTPYNTRRKVGLPPTGICSPSKAAVEAALFPLDSPYFYYLHGLDKRIHPAITYDEHLQNIKAYR